MIPIMFVARLKVKKVYADVPEALQAKAHLMDSRMQSDNSARQSIVMCERTLRIRMLLPGLLKIRLGKIGSSLEPLIAKNTVKNSDIAVNTARSNTNDSLRAERFGMG